MYEQSNYAYLLLSFIHSCVHQFILIKLFHHCLVFNYKKKKKKIKLGMYHLLKALSLFYRELLHYLVFELSHWGELPTVAPKRGFPLPVAWFQVHGHKLPNASFLLWPVHLISQKRKINTIFQFIGYDQCHGKVIRNRDYCFISSHEHLIVISPMFFLLFFFFLDF